MEKRDLIKKQIEQIGKALGEILACIRGAKDEGDLVQSVISSNQRLLSELDIDIEMLLGLEYSDLLEYFNARNLTVSHLEVLAEYLVEVGKSKKDESEMGVCFERAIYLLDAADEISKTMSFSRMHRKGELKARLS